MAYFHTLEVSGFRPAIWGARHPLKSYERMDSYLEDNGNFQIGANDYNLMRKLCNAGDPSHYKFIRMIQVWADIQAPRFWWSEADTYGVGVVKNSQSTMHRLMKDGVSKNDLDYIWGFDNYLDDEMNATLETLDYIIEMYNKTEGIEKENYFRMAKSFLPECFMQTRMVNLNYQVLRNMYNQRKNHRLKDWNIDFVNWINTLPLGQELIKNEWK